MTYFARFNKSGKTTLFPNTIMKADTLANLIFFQHYHLESDDGIECCVVKRLHVCAQNAGYLSRPSKKINYQLKACF